MAEPTTDLEQMLTTAEAAAMLSVAPRTLEDWRRRTGKGPPVTYLTRALPRYRLGDVLAWLESRRDV